jgi:hypothetical protein
MRWEQGVNCSALPLFGSDGALLVGVGFGNNFLGMSIWRATI